MSQPITNLSEGTFIKLQETVDGNTLNIPYIIRAKGTDNPYGSDKVFVFRSLLHKIGSWNTTNTYIEYGNSLIHNKLQTEWKNRYSTSVLSAIATSTVPCWSAVLDETYTVSTQFFIPTPGDYGLENNQLSVVDPSTKLNTVSNYIKDVDDGTISGGGDTRYVGQYTRLCSSSAPLGRNGNTNTFGFGEASFHRNANEKPSLICCNILATALVSDEPDEDGYYALIPDPDDPYLYVRFHCSLGTVDDMPLKVRVDLTTEGDPEITSLQVCNNYGDETPTWENMTVGAKHTFVNTTKTSNNWEIGVKVEARGENTIRVYEPFAIIQTEVDE